MLLIWNTILSRIFIKTVTALRRYELQCWLIYLDYNSKLRSANLLHNNGYLLQLSLDSLTWSSKHLKSRWSPPQEVYAQLHTTWAAVAVFTQSSTNTYLYIPTRRISSHTDRNAQFAKNSCQCNNLLNERRIISTVSLVNTKSRRENERKPSCFEMTRYCSRDKIEEQSNMFIFMLLKWCN